MSPCNDDEFGITLQDPDQPPTPGEYMLRHYPSVESDSAEFRAALPQMVITPSDLDFISSPFDTKACIELEVVLPPQGNDHRMHFALCDSFKLPMITGIHPASPVQPYIPQRYQQDHYIVSIDNIEPITPESTIKIILDLQVRNKSHQVTFVFHPVDTSKSSNYEGSRARHDSMRTLRHHHIAICKDLPPTPKTIFAALDSKDSCNWKEALWHQFDKNQAVQLYSAPLPLEQVPKDIKILPSIIACTVKPYGEDTYKFNTRHCVNGNGQEKGIDFESSYSPTASASSVRFQLCYSVIHKLLFGLADVDNCFQNTLIPLAKRLAAHAPPKFMEWYRF